MKKQVLLILSIVTLFILSCRKDSFITSKDAIVQFSADTLFFDTVFVSTGSVTQVVKIINGNDQQLRLSDVKLMGGAQSYFSININGSPGPGQQNLVLAAGDSLYIFVAVSIRPGAGSLPFIIQDSIQVAFNGVQQFIQLQAWGQNAHFLQDQVIKSNTTWDNTLPYVILGGLQVDTNVTLTIPQGCKVYVHANAPILVDGTLQVTGDKYDSTKVYFLGDRMDEPYSEYPGSWPGIYFRGTSINNHLKYAVIKNAYQAVVAESPSTNANPKLILEECIIDNSYDAGILGAESSIQASNSLISNCGKNIELGYGGSYQFTNCTAAAFSNDLISHTQPVLSVSNYVVQDAGIQTADLNASFVNCIFWGNYGSVTNEVQVFQQGSNPFSVSFANCLWKVQNTPTGVDTTAMITNADPLFDSVDNFRRIYDFHLKPASPAINKGKATGLIIDLDGKPRPVGLPDLGCYEMQ